MGNKCCGASGYNSNLETDETVVDPNLSQCKLQIGALLAPSQILNTVLSHLLIIPYYRLPLAYILSHGESMRRNGCDWLANGNHPIAN